MLGIKKYTQKMNASAIQLERDALLFKLTSIGVEHRAMIRKVNEEEQHYVLERWMMRRHFATIETRIAIENIKTEKKFKYQISIHNGSK